MCDQYPVYDFKFCLNQIWSVIELNAFVVTNKYGENASILIIEYDVVTNVGIKNSDRN